MKPRVRNGGFRQSVMYGGQNAGVTNTVAEIAFLARPLCSVGAQTWSVWTAGNTTSGLPSGPGSLVGKNAGGAPLARAGYRHGALRDGRAKVSGFEVVASG